RISIPAPATGWGEKAVVTLSFDGQGSAFYTASLGALLGGEDRPPVSSGFEITRSYFQRAADGSSWSLEEGPITPGRTALVLLQIQSNVARDYVMITDPRPDGFEPLDVPMSEL